ncbi:permease for cytosine/purines, uracil, thiamine, allantoin-domain-containing protein [Tricladium varicosporioides]|nr:permease for cytosine/purines, uracil, thiamine, allantoin-domain-containing protein [Hymenoscyphus varicosporioides]
MEEVDLAAIPHPTSKLQRFANRLEAIAGIEARGIERVPESERERKYAAKDYLYMAMIWFSANCTANNLTVGILGPIAYGLGFVDAMICCLFGTILGSCLTAYISTFGPVSGNRTLVIARYTMGWWPSKLCVLLNLVIELGYGVVDTIVAGLILSAVNGSGMSVIVGIVVAALISWAVSTFGIKFFNMFERYTWIPQVCILFIFVGVASPHFDVKTPSAATGVTLIGNRLSYVFLSASGPLGWSAAAADFYVYFPPKAPRWLVFAMTASGLILGKLFVEFLGIGLGSGLALNPSWAAAQKVSTGALIVEALTPLGAFGSFCAVLLALGVVANNIPGTYSASLSFQLIGGWATKIPRMVWSTVAVIIYTVCAIAGRAYLLLIFLNFLALIGYWTIIWITLTIEEEVIFRRKSGYDWTAWNEKRLLPVGLAALGAFLIGWVGAVLGMDQTYFVGPIAILIGDYGADIGLPLAAAWSALVYPPLRYLELKHFGR